MGYPAWPAGRTCIFSLQFWLTWHAAKPRTAQLYFHFTVVAIWYLISVINMAILIFWICTLQDSVPAGSYNDPFFSSVMRILQPQTESGPRNYFFIFFILFFIFFLFHIILRSCEIFIFIFFHSPIMWKCHSHLFIVFPSCAVNIIMCILVPSRLVDTQRKTSKSKTQKLRPQPQFLWGRNSRLLQVRIRLTLVN